MLVWRKISTEKWADSWQERLLFLGWERLVITHLGGSNRIRLEIFEVTQPGSDFAAPAVWWRNSRPSAVDRRLGESGHSKKSNLDSRAAADLESPSPGIIGRFRVITSIYRPD